MITSGDTQLLSAPGWSDPRVHLLDDTWLLTIFTILLATALPWLVSAFDIDFVATSLGLLLLGAIHVALTTLGRSARIGERRWVLTMLHVTGVFVIGYIWMHAGGLQNPAFLMIFVLPIVGAIFLSRWQPYLMALLAVSVVGTAALAQAPELRWYAPGLNTVGAWLAAVIGGEGGVTDIPFPGFNAPSGYFVVLLEVFAILMIACSIAAEYLGTIFERLHAHVDTARTDAERGQEFWANLIEEFPLPALLVDTDSLNILCASKQASVFCATDLASGGNLFEAIHFTYPDVIQELITQAGGVASLSMIRVGDRLHATEVRVQHTALKGRRFALVAIHDKTEEFTVRAAFDLTGQAALVIDSNDRIVTFNKPARALFAGIQKDAVASELLSLSGMPARWWEPDLTGRRKMQVEIAPRIYQVTSSASLLPGEEEQLYIVTLQPVARAAISDRTVITATLQPAGTTDATIVSRTLVTPS
jgi:hypothetical protein